MDAYGGCFIITSGFFRVRHYPWICHQLNIYGINSVDVFAIAAIHRKHYRSCVTHLCTSAKTSHTPLSNDWLVLCVGDTKLSLLQKMLTHVTELSKPPYCMTISVCQWFIAIMVLRKAVEIALCVMPIWLLIIRFLSIFFSMWKVLSIKLLYLFFCWLVYIKICFYNSNTTGSTSGSGTTYPSGVPEFTSIS